MRDSKKRNIEMIEDDEKDLLKRKLEELKEAKFKLEEEIIKLNSQIDELFQERLECEKNALNYSSYLNLALLIKMEIQ